MSTYAYFAGGAVDWGLKLDRSRRALKITRPNGTCIGGQQLALFGDVVVLDEFPGSWPMRLTNHWNAKGTEGGNVGFDDGSVRWLALSADPWASDAYVKDTLGQVTAGLPFNTIYVKTMNGCKLRTPYGAYTRGFVQMGSSGDALPTVFP